MPAENLLGSWNDAPARREILDFVQSEKPIPIQLDFTLFRMAEQAGRNRSLRDRQPYQATVERDYRWIGDAVVSTTTATTPACGC